jgi:hypothetical protein
VAVRKLRCVIDFIVYSVGMVGWRGGGAGDRADSALCCVTIRAIVTKLHCESIETKRVTRAISCKSEKRDRVRKRKK